MYIYSPRGRRDKDRSRSNRLRSKLKAKNRRRVNRMGKKKLGVR